VSDEQTSFSLTVQCFTGFIPRNFRELTFVILLGIGSDRILAAPTTEPGRRGWEWRL